jgi:hypothetical protein
MATPPPHDNGATTDGDQLQTPQRRRSSPSPIHRRGRPGRPGHDQSAALVRMVREVSGQFPLLMKTNYSDWFSMMHIMLCAQGLWIIVKEGLAGRRSDGHGGSTLGGWRWHPPLHRSPWPRVRGINWSCLGSAPTMPTFHRHIASASSMRTFASSMVNLSTTLPSVSQ